VAFFEHLKPDENILTDATVLHYDWSVENINSLIAKIKSRGHKITRGRKRILQILLNLNAPVTASELMKLLEEKEATLNKTTVYRELEFLQKEGLVRTVQLDERKQRFELIKGDHHHHLVCKNCKNVEDVAFASLEEQMKMFEKQLKYKSQFREIKHSLEFFGLCRHCQ